MKDLALELEATVRDFADEITQITLNEWSLKDSPEKWSRKETLGHLIDSAYNNIQRFVRATYDENFKFIYFQNEWVNAQKYQTADEKELVQLWILLNKNIVRIFKNFPIDRQNVLIDIGRDEKNFQTVKFIATDYLRHLIHHIQQIKE